MRIFSLIAILFFSVGASANMNQWTSRFLEVDPTIRSAKLKHEESQARVSEAWSAIFPSVDLNLARSETEAADIFGSGSSSAFSSLFSDVIYTASIDVTQSLYLGGRIWAGVDLRKAGERVASSAYRHAENNSILMFLSKAVDWALIDDEIKAVKESRKAQQSYVALTRRKVKRGTAKGYELDQNLADLYSYETRLTQLEQNKRALKKELAETLQWDEGDIGDLKLPSINMSIPTELDRLIDLAWDQRPDYLQAVDEVELSRINKRLEVGEHLPTLAVSGSWGYQSDTFSGLGDDGTDNSSIAISLSIPIFSGLSSMHIRKANNRAIMSSEMMLEKKRRDVRAEVHRSLLEFTSAKKLYDQSVRWSRSAERAFKGGDKNFKNGVIGNVQMIQLQVSRERAKLGLVNARRVFQLSAAKLFASVGINPLEMYK